MKQSRETGAEAARFGHTAAAQIERRIGARKVSTKSNEFELDGKRITIRVARQGNHQVGVLYGMLQRIHSVIAAFETTPNEYELFSIPTAAFSEAARDSVTSKGRVGLVQKKIFFETGTLVARVTLTKPPN